MRNDITVIELDDRERWKVAHRQGGLPSQSWEYAWGLSASGMKPKLAVVDAEGARMLLPFVERAWQDSIDVATILGASGASVSPSSVAPLELWREFVTGCSWVSGYIQLAANFDIELLRNSTELVANNTTFLLSLAYGDIVPRVSRTIRRKIKAACEEGSTLVDDLDILRGHVPRLYAEAMDRVGAAPHYRFSTETLDRWLLDPAALVLGAQVGDEIEAVYVFRTAGDVAEAHITGSTAQGRRLVPWLIWQGVQRLQRRGIRSLDLGATPRTGDGLYQFKEKFRGEPKAIHALHQIYDRRRYDELTRIAGVTGPSRWFPAYRASAA